MNYIELINKFWSCSIERAFNPSDCTLYFFLLNTCNSLHWKQPFGQSDRYLSLTLGISVPTIREAKNRLKQRGVINFKAPDTRSKSSEGQTKYWFPSLPTVQPTYTDTCTDPYTDACTDPLTNNKQNKTKLNKEKNTPVLPSSKKEEDLSLDLFPEEKEKSSAKKEKGSAALELQYPFHSKAFRTTWDTLVSMPKWKKKMPASLQAALNRLAKYSEEFAVLLVENAISGGYQGVVFPSTDADYQKWKGQPSAKKNIYQHNAAILKKTCTGYEEFTES